MSMECSSGLDGVGHDGPQRATRQGDLEVVAAEAASAAQRFVGGILDGPPTVALDKSRLGGVDPPGLRRQTAEGQG